MPSRHNPKLIGERAECAFMWEAMERGLIVSKPFGDSAPYDVVVDSREAEGKSKPQRTQRTRRGGTRLLRVQVRTVLRKNGRGYKVDTRHGMRRRPMMPADADFLAALVRPEKTWYIIPVRAFAPANHISLYPHVPGSGGRWERYRNAWDMMGAGR